METGGVDPKLMVAAVHSMMKGGEYFAKHAQMLTASFLTADTSYASELFQIWLPVIKKMASHVLEVRCAVK